MQHPYSKRPCKYCGAVRANHYPYQCFDNPKRKTWKIKKIGKVTESWLATRRVWFANNPPDKNGYYHCYLGISPKCLNRLTPRQTTLDHIKPRGSNPELRNDLTNLMPCCIYCNNLKGSRKLEDIIH